MKLETSAAIGAAWTFCVLCRLTISDLENPALLFGKLNSMSYAFVSKSDRYGQVSDRLTSDSQA
ncbi:uncharacterized protein BCR38DRAFT_448968 [Pseudomassariella vexata]|uniref:Uncharacterized protein n=1 Tax=Pseudomassariella vexata TaxID=1141098 RepID=A0A1Y2DGR7_9PEZI|nr:uncharacterized protein BCR38DRAFT_448968 [Pseudomassariella vexata]ORY57895.1 hypothetical protein BCR38DRAFT_448968 [Pseudomassariella vexata]